MTTDPLGSADPAHLAVVVPTLNEERTISSCLHSIGRPPGLVVVVTDGGSTDATLEIVASERPEALVVRGPAGRGGQLRRGAEAILSVGYLFLHADCRLPEGWHAAVRMTLADPTVALGCFRLRHELPPGISAGRLGRIWWRLPDLRARGWRLPYGDQAQFLRRDVLETIGGFPAIPLMEDVALSRRCLRLGRLARLPLEVRTSARRFVRRPLQARLCMLTFPTLYRLGVSPEVLARWYSHVR